MVQKFKEKITKYGRVLASWAIPDSVPYERGPFWYVMAALIGGGMFLYAIFTANFLFAIILMMIALIMFLGSRKEPQMLSFQITETGIIIGERFTPYTDMTSFWIIYEPPEVKKLYFDFQSSFKPSLSVSLEDENPVQIREILKEYLPENTEREEESFIDFVGRKLKI